MQVYVDWCMGLWDRALYCKALFLGGQTNNRILLRQYLNPAEICNGKRAFVSVFTPLILAEL